MTNKTKNLMSVIVAFFVLQTSFFAPFGSAYAQQDTTRMEFPDLRKTDNGHVARMIDPITMQMEDGRLVRLSGLELPDYRPLDPGDFALAALAVMDDLVAGKNVTLYQTNDKETGRMNRMGHALAHISRDDNHLWAQGVLLRLGLARANPTPRNPEMAKEMMALETLAREEKLGVWGDERFSVLNIENAETKINSFQIIEGTIRSAAMKNNRIYLNFGEDWREDFTISIPSAARRLFSKAGLDPLTWAGQRIRVRGWLENYNGPSIVLETPSALELLSTEPIPASTMFYQKTDK